MTRPLVAVMLVLVTSLAMPGDASAHTDVDYTLPADGASVGEPIERISVAFTEPVTLVGNGFQVFDPQGDVVAPTPITDDGVVFRLILDEPIAGGEVGVIYEVTSADGHVVSGGFRFLVDAPVPTTTVPTTTLPTTTVPTTTLPTTTLPTTLPVPATTDVPTTSTQPTDTTVTTALTEPDGGSTGLIIGGAVAIAIAAAAFVLFRARTGG